MDKVNESEDQNEIGMRRTRVDAGLADITDGGTLDHVPHSEPLDSLVLADAARAVRAAHEGDVATSLLVTAAISSFLGLDNASEGRKISALSWRPVEPIPSHTTSKVPNVHPSQIPSKTPEISR